MLNAQKVDLNLLQGRWYIIHSDFPMWTKGNKIKPTFNYKIIERKGDTVLLDEVKYFKNGKEKTITGYDLIESQDNRSFIWRGKGLLSITKSKWRIIFFSDDKRWAIIHFQKTLFTPEGYDVISRNKAIDYNLSLDIKAILSGLNISELKLIPQL